MNSWGALWGYVHWEYSSVKPAVIAAIITASATIVVALLSVSFAYLSSKRDRRRAIYADAVKAAVSWEEMLYRVRRRDKTQTRELINQFHSLQDDLAYHRAWIGSESRYLKRSYNRLVENIQEEFRPLISKAWDAPLRKPPGDKLPDDVCPDVSAHIDSFLADVRSHLSWQPWRKGSMMWRNRQSAQRGK